jgi:predicted O-methyltransferase YrrM
MNDKIKFEINDNYNTVELACKSRIDLFNLSSISNYSKILYLDTDIVIKGSLKEVFDIVTDDILYVLEEGLIDQDYFGKKLFSNEELNSYSDKTSFTSGILLFNNCEKIKYLFKTIHEDMIKRRYLMTAVFDQTYIIYNAFKYNCFNNKLLNKYAVNNSNDIKSDKVIHHFPGGPGNSEPKIVTMSKFLRELKDSTISNNINKAKEFININLLPIIQSCGEPLEGNIFMIHHTTRYTDVFINKAKNISNLVLNQNIKSVMEIGFNSGFSALLMLLTNPYMNLTCFDLGEHSYTLPCFLKIKETFGDRINIIIGDSTKTLQNINEKYDLIHIDGGHSTEVAESDILNSYRLSIPGTILIMDDYDFSNLHTLWDQSILKYKLHPLNILIYDSPHHDIKFV